MGVYKKRRVGIILGGYSSESAISLLSGAAVENALKRLGYETVRVDLAVKSDWALLFDKKIDVAFLAVHGAFGEDGTLQGLLELLQIPYTGSGVMASSICMDKGYFKTFVGDAGIRTPRGICVHGTWDWDLSSLSFPLIVKPARLGSSIGVSLVQERAALKDAFVLAEKYDRRVVVEEYKKGKEITVGILGEEAFAPIEIITPALYDYSAKYQSKETRYQIPAEVSEPIIEQLRQIAIQCYHLVGCRGYARVDFIVEQEEVPYVLEVNTLPGMTERSLLPKAAAYFGLSFEELVKAILDRASLDYGDAKIS